MKMSAKKKWIDIQWHSATQIEIEDYETMKLTKKKLIWMIIQWRCNTKFELTSRTFKNGLGFQNIQKWKYLVYTIDVAGVDCVCIFTTPEGDWLFLTATGNQLRFERDVDGVARRILKIEASQSVVCGASN